MKWSSIYAPQIEKEGGLLPFISNKEKRSAGALVNRIRKALKPKAKILEIGTGTGAIGALLTKYGFDVIATDNDLEMIEIAKNSFSLFGDNQNVIFLDAKDIIKNFGKNSFDCVITHGMLEHYSDEKIILYLRDQLEVSPLAICVVPTKSMSEEYRRKGFGNERYLSTKYWKKLISNNFKLNNVFGFGLKESNYYFIPEKINKGNALAKILAPLCAFNEFWITRN